MLISSLFLSSFFQISDMSLIKKITKVIDATIDDFTRLIAEKYGLDQIELLDTWKEVVTNKNQKPKKPKSAYQVFAAEQRKILKEEYPDITFGQIATETGKRWQLLDYEEKAAYAPNKEDATVVPVKKTEVSAPKAKSKADLLKVAESMGLNIAKNKTKNEILEAIAEAEEKNKSEYAASEKSELASEASMAASDSEYVPSDGEVSPIDTMKMVESEEEEEEELEKFKSMKTKDLSALCKEKGLAYTGNKEVLIRRLLHN